MHALIRRAFRFLTYVAAAAVMLLALLVGIARLLLPRVPEYQDDIRTWAVQATGFELRFEHISASWPITGPEIQFLEVTVQSPQDHQPVFTAERLDIGVSLISLLRDRAVVVSRVGVEGTRVEIRRGAGNVFEVQGRQLADYLPARDPQASLRLPELDFELSGIEVAYRDVERSGDVLDFTIRNLDLRLGDSDLSLDGDVTLSSRFGERAAVSIDVPLGVLESVLADGDADEEPNAEEWSAYVTGEALDFAHIVGYALDMATPLANMRGDIVVWAGFTGTGPTGVTAELDFTDVELHRSPDLVDRYEEISGRIEWERDADGWLLAGSGLNLRREGRFSPRSDFSLRLRGAADEKTRQWQGSAAFLRLQDWFPILRAIVTEDVRDQMLPSDVSGDIRDLALGLRSTPGGDTEFDLDLRFDDLGIAGLPGGRTLTGMTGAVVADQDGGRLELDSDKVVGSMPQAFAAPLKFDRLEGFFVWRSTAGGLRILSDNVRLDSPVFQTSSRFELVLPPGGESAYLDLTASVTAASSAGVVRYLPLRRFPKKAAAWLDRAIVAGQITRADLALRGPIREFPFDHDEGMFKVTLDMTDATLDFARGWPRVENLEGRFVFDGVALRSRRNQANLGGVPVANARVNIADLRRGTLVVTGPQTATAGQVLEFLRASPVANAVGPTLERMEASGSLSANVDLRIPLKRPKEYALKIDVDTENAQLDLAPLNFGLRRIAGSLQVRNTVFYADALSAELLGEPVTIRMRPGEVGGPYAQFVTIYGRSPVRSWIDAFDLPQADSFSGTTDWQTLMLFPKRRTDGASTPTHVLVRSDLAGVESRLPAPLAKSADTVRALELDIALPGQDELEVAGRFGDGLNAVLRFEAAEDRWSLERGAIHVGSAAALLPLEPGIEVSGRADFVRIDDWLELTGEGEAGWTDLYSSATLRIDRLAAFGQIFPDVGIDARREGDEWRLAAEGPNLAGTIRLPRSPDNDTPVEFDMQRLWLIEDDPGDVGESDPRSVVPVNVSADDFVLGKLHFGRLRADLRSTPSGVTIAPIDMQGESFAIEGDAAWLVHPNDESLQRSRMRLALNGTNIQAVLASFGYDPVIEGKAVTAAADLAWAGAPDSGFLYRAEGGFSVDMKNGAVLPLEPGGGRLLGVLSVTALPRRLALDFRDVTDEGLGFDTLHGDFTLDKGNVYTCNLGVEGSVADMGIVGRAGLESEDYDQLAVVRPHVSNLFALGGAVVAGPAAGAAMLLFSQIFRKPLSQLGESYYRVTGSWDNPEIVRLQGSDVDLTPLKNCETYVEDALTAAPDE